MGDGEYGGVQVGGVRMATSIASRLRGLLGAGPSNELLVLAPCKGIHTYGMDYPIDVAFVDKTGSVVLARRALEPGGRIECRTASMAIERAHASKERWFEIGDKVTLGIDESRKKGERQ